MHRTVLVALCLAAPAVPLTAVADGRPAREPPADTPLLDCRDRITGAFTQVGDKITPYRFRVRPRHDTRIGPIAFSGARDLGTRATYDAMVRDDQWLKTIALVRRGARVTLEVPRAQRSWMRLEYAEGVHAATLEGCPRRPSAEACGPGPRDTCARGPTPFSGGFTIDYDAAPRQGRCAELIVWVEGREQPLRGRVFRPRGVACPP